MAAVEESGAYASTTSDGFTVTSNTETADQLKENLASEPVPKDGEAPDPEKEEAEKVSKAAAELGARGGKAAAEKRAAEAKETSEEDEPAAEPEEKPLGKPRDDPKARMLEATRKEAAAKREAAEARREAQQLAEELARERQARQAPAEPAVPKADPDAKPDAKDFDDYADFVEARARWAARQEYTQAQRHAQVQSQVAAYTRAVEGAVSKFQERVGKVTKADQAFMDKVSAEVWDGLQPSFQLEPGQQPNAYNLMADEVITSEQAPALLLHFTEHPDDFQRIASLRTPREVSREMAKLEARLDAAPAGTSIRAVSSAAKPPVRPVTGSPSTVDTDDDELPFEEFVRRSNARDKQRARAR